ncbi:MAG: hypothetical protein RLW42_09330, partial [Gammaproteobacteria bacterium]
VVVLIVIVVRGAALGRSDDPALHEAIRAHLVNDLGGRLGVALDAADPADEADVAELLERADASRIALHEVAVSKPLLSFGSTAEAIVHCVYTLPGEASEAAYWRFSDQAIDGWRYRGHSSAVSYYLNFF